MSKPVTDVLETPVSDKARVYTDIDVSVNDLTVDPQVQRFHFNPRKVEQIVKNYNPDMIGRITASRRNAVTIVIVDGWHRWEAVRRLTDSTGTIPVRVFEGLTLAEEAQMFLTLNPGNQPTALDRYRMRLIIGEPVIVAADKALHEYGWAVHPMPGNSHLQCVKAVERVQLLATKNEGQEDLLANTMRVISRAWGHGREGATATLIEGIAAFLLEHRNRKQFDEDRLIQALKSYSGQAFGLLGDAQQLARMSKMRPAMAVADQVTKEYNRGLRVGGSSELPAWRKAR